MAETYLQLAQRIEELQQKAASMKDREMAEVIERIQTAIKAYGLTAEQLFGSARTPASSGKVATKKSVKASSGAKFRDEAGNVWSGRGPRPRWIKAAIAAGKSMDEFAVKGVAESADKPLPRRTAKAAPTPKYKDGAGHSWSGRGPKPRWFKAALEAGQTLEQLAV